MRCPECQVHAAHGHLLGCATGAGGFPEDVERAVELLEMATGMLRDESIAPLERALELGRLAGRLVARAARMELHAEAIAGAAGSPSWEVRARCETAQTPPPS